MSRRTQADVAEARARLRELLKPGDTIWCTVRYVSSSGMSRGIDFYLLTCGKDGPDRIWLSRLIATACEYRFNERHECVSVSGCGMDMGFAVVYDLAHALFGPRKWSGADDKTRRRFLRWRRRMDEREPYGNHEEGYALSHRWL